jgi:hypothetical protein
MNGADIINKTREFIDHFEEEGLKNNYLKK